MFSGVATMSKELVLGTIHHFNWIQIAGSIKHPEFGKIIDMSKSIQKETGIEDAQLKLYPMNGYGNPDILRQILSMEKDINAIMHFTDPRQWLWLVSMENELRQNIPLVYYALWDDLPYPMYNQGHYRSCDLIMGISKQSNNLHKNVLGPYSNKTKTTYVPHGINSEVFKPVLDIDPKFEEFRKKLLGDKKYDKIFLYNNRNIRRKMPGDLINSYKQFCDTLTKEEADRCLLIFHTRPVDNSGTDIPAVHQALCPEYNIMYSTQKVSAQELNYLYNVVDVTLGISSAEGFGLATAESLMAGTPILVNVTGGLQDQCGFVDSEGKLIEYSSDFPSNSCGRYADAAE
jgi:glycosyltransferase involved in cell wall biosynthesis